MIAARVFIREETPLTQAQLDCAVASATGESLRMIHHLGFSVVGSGPADLETEDPVLVLDCPFCGRAVPYPGRCRDGSVGMAECDRCDIYFDCDETEVYTAQASPLEPDTEVAISR